MSDFPENFVDNPTVLFIGIGVCVIFIVALIVLCIWIYCRKKRTYEFPLQPVEPQSPLEEFRSGPVPPMAPTPGIDIIHDKSKCNFCNCDQMSSSPDCQRCSQQSDNPVLRDIPPKTARKPTQKKVYVNVTPNS